jgi:hypothetical protein
MVAAGFGNPPGLCGGSLIGLWMTAGWNSWPAAEHLEWLASYASI